MENLIGHTFDMRISDDWVDQYKNGGQQVLYGKIMTSLKNVIRKKTDIGRIQDYYWKTDYFRVWYYYQTKTQTVRFKLSVVNVLPKTTRMEIMEVEVV